MIYEPLTAGDWCDINDSGLIYWGRDENKQEEFVGKDKNWNLFRNLQWIRKIRKELTK